MTQVYKIYVYDIDGHRELEIVSTPEDQSAESGGELVRKHISGTVDLDDINIEANSSTKIGEVTIEDGNIISSELVI